MHVVISLYIYSVQKLTLPFWLAYNRCILLKKSMSSYIILKILKPSKSTKYIKFQQEIKTSTTTSCSGPHWVLKQKVFDDYDKELKKKVLKVIFEIYFLYIFVVLT